MQMNNVSPLRVIPILGFIAILASCSAESKKARLKEKADEYFQSGEYDKAKIEYLNLLRVDPQDPNAIRQLGMIWLEQGAPLQAIPFLLKTRELEPENLDARKTLATALRKLGSIQEARNEANEILKQDPQNQNALLLLAETALSKEDIAATEIELRKVEESAPAVYYLASAILAAKKGDLAAAKIAVQRALKLDPESVEAHMVMSSLLALNGNRDQAVKELEEAASLSPLRSDARLRLAELKLLSGNAPDARNMLKVLVEEAPDFLPAWVLLARIDFSERKYEEALAKLENVFGRDYMNYSGRILEAQTLLAQAEFSKALETLKRLDETYPNLPMTKLSLAKAFQASGESEQAIAVLEEAMKLSPDSMEAGLLLAELRLRTGDPGPVVVAMKDLLKSRPDSLRAELLLAEAYRASGNFDDAAELLRERIAASPEVSQPHYLLGLVLRQQKKPEEARMEFEKARELAPDDLAALSQLTDLDLEKGDFDAALDRVRQQMEKTPDRAGVHFMAARIYAAQKNWDEAEAALQKTIHLDATFSGAHEQLVGSYVKAGKLPEAIEQIEQMRSKNPGDARALILAGLIYVKSNDFAKAAQAYEELIEVKPEFIPAINDLAYWYAEKLNQLDRAYALAQKARAAEPDSAAIADTLGWVHFKRGDYSRALMLLQESAEKDPNQPEILFHLGMAHYMMGETEKARAALLQAVDSNAPFESRAEAQRRLALLEEMATNAKAPSSVELELLLEEQPSDIVARMRLAEAYEREGAPGKAAAAYEAAFGMNTNLTTAALKVAELNAGPLENHLKAFEFAKKARNLAPTDPKVAALLGKLAYQTGNFAWAYSLLHESARQLGDNASILCDLGWAAYSLGKVNEARETMQRALDLAPNSPTSGDARTFLSTTALSQQGAGKVEGAEAEVQKVLQADPSYVPALMVLAKIQNHRGNSEEAAASYNKILQRFPDFAPAQKRLAVYYAKDPESLAKAYDLARKARETLPDDPELTQILAVISFQMEDYAYALQLLQNSARKKPLGAVGLYYLGMCHLQMKQEEQSREILKRSLAKGLQGPFLENAERALAELQKQ